MKELQEKVVPEESKRKPVSYRLARETIELIGKLKVEWGVENDTRVIERAIDRCANKPNSINEIETELKLSKEGIKNYFMIHGIQLQPKNTVKVPIGGLSSEDRGYIWDCMESNSGKLDLSYSRIPNEADFFLTEESIDKLTPNVYFESSFLPETIEDWSRLLKEHREARDKKIVEFKELTDKLARKALSIVGKLIDSNDITKSPDEISIIKLDWKWTIGDIFFHSREFLDKYNEYSNLHKKFVEDLREQKKTEKAEWIENHGSTHLSKAFKLGYDCQKMYLNERRLKEFPEFSILKKEMSFDSADSPSLASLQLAESVGGRVVNLYEEKKGIESEYTDYLGEGVVIQNWLDHTILYKVVEECLF